MATRQQVETRSGPRAVCRPQGTCPKQWIAQVDGETLFDKRGGQKRFASEAAALKAAVAHAGAA